MTISSNLSRYYRASTPWNFDEYHRVPGSTWCFKLDKNLVPKYLQKPRLGDTHNYITRTKGNISQTISSTKSLYNDGVTEYYKIKKELKYEGSDVKLFRKNVKDVMLKR